MKTSIVTIAIALSTVFGISKSGFAATASKEEATTLTEVSRINKIIVQGNVELYVSDGITDNVKVYNHYYAESALVQDQKGVLRISSYTDQKLVVWVTVSDLSTMTLYDNAVVKSFGKLSAIDLDIQLHDNASAQLTMDVYSANITLKDHAKADLAGDITEVELHDDQTTFLNTTNLTAIHLVKKASRPEGIVAGELASL